MNRVTRRYLERSAQDPALRTAVADADLSDSYRRSWGAGLLPRPCFVPEDELLACARDVDAVFDLLASLPDRVHDGDVVRYCDELGIDPVIARLLGDYRDGPPTRYGRADLYHDGTSFKLLEFNVASDIGGLDRAELHRALLAVPAFARFAEEHALTHVDTGAAVARSLRAAAPVPDPVVAILCADGDLVRYRHLLDSTADVFRRAGLAVVLGELSGVRHRGGRLYVGGTRVDVVLRYFTVDHVAGNERAVREILGAHADGGATLFTTMDSSLYSNKGALALLSDPRWLSPEERAVVDRVLPWTRPLTNDLLELCRVDRERLVVKPPRDFGGRGVAAGWELSEKDWMDVLADGVRRSCVVQRRVVPVPESVVDSAGSVSDWVTAWGVFVTPEGYAGTDIRALPVGAGAVVNYGSNPAARVTGAFAYR